MNDDRLKIIIDFSLYNKLVNALDKSGNNELINCLNTSRDLAINKLVAKKKIVESNRETLVFKTKNKIKKAVLELKEEGKKVNPNSVNKKCGVAIVTINKYIDLLK